MVNVALIGIGYWGQKLQRYIEESKDFSLKYACNSKTDLNDIWGDGDVEAVVIATPNETHYSLARSALLSGKHVLVEKPPAMTFQEYSELYDLSRGNRLGLLTDYNYTLSESLRKAQALASSIGDLLVVAITIKRIDRFDNRDVYQVLGSHALSILSMFAPLSLLQLQRLDTVRENGRVRAGVLTFASKQIVGRIDIDLKGQRKTEVAIHGQRGDVTYDPSKSPPLTATISGKGLMFRFGEAHNLRYVLEYFHRVINGEVQDNLITAMTISRILWEVGCEG